MGIFTKINEFFSKWFRNWSTEKDIRLWLSKNGYDGNNALLSDVELHAIGRPGWLQIYRFKAEAKKSGGSRIHLFGAVRSDERFGSPKVFICQSFQEQAAKLNEWSDGLIVRRRR